MIARYCLLAGVLLSLSTGCGRVGYDLIQLTDQGAQNAGEQPATGGLATGGSGGGFDGGNGFWPDAGVVHGADGGPSSDGQVVGMSDAGGAPMGFDAGGGPSGVDAAVCEAVASAADSGVLKDTTCDGIDDDCDSVMDEDYVVVQTCGLGACESTATQSSCSLGVETLCAPGPALAADDRTFDGIDDDCDGEIDEDSCDSMPADFSVGTYTLAVPEGCNSIAIKLWGAGGGSSGSDNATPGDGGAGGYVESTLRISGALDLYVGGGGAGCGAAGQNPGSGSYSGGAGGEGVAVLSNPGAPGEDGVVDGGGLGGTNSGGGEGGRGHYGGGGGAAGASAAWPTYATDAGGGGAASVLLMGGTLVATAGGGGGGGSPSGAGSAPIPPILGGTGGEGCAGPGGDSATGGGGGGGGVCIGTTTAQGVAGIPAMDSLLPGSEARGGAGGNCRAGGDGYAQVLFLRE